jgi:hypothetical protein
VHPDQLFAAPAQTVAGLSVDIHDPDLIVHQKKSVRRAVDKRAEARLARAQFLLGALALGDVDRGPHEFHDLSRTVHHGMPDGSEYAGPCRQAARSCTGWRCPPFRQRISPESVPAYPVVGVHSFQDGFPGRCFRLPIESEKAVELL